MVKDLVPKPNDPSLSLRTHKELEPHDQHGSRRESVPISCRMYCYEVVPPENTLRHS